MNIVYIEHYAGTPALGMEFRPYYLAREWVRAGHRVTVALDAPRNVRILRGELEGPAQEFRATPAEHHPLACPAVTTRLVELDAVAAPSA